MPFSTAFRLVPSDRPTRIPPEILAPQERLRLGMPVPESFDAGNGFVSNPEDPMELTRPEWLTPDLVRRIAAAGRNGDGLAANITPGVANLLKALGGSGSINPRTKMPEFWAEGSGDLAGHDPGENSGIGGSSSTGGAGATEDRGWLAAFGDWVAEKAGKLNGLDLLSTVAPAGGLLAAGFGLAKDRNERQIQDAIEKGNFNANGSMFGSGLMGEKVGISGEHAGPVNPDTGVGGPGEGGGADAGGNSSAGPPGTAATAAAASNQAQDNANQLAAQNAKNLMADLFASRTTGRPNGSTFTSPTTGGGGAFARLLAEAYGDRDMGFSNVISGGAAASPRGKWDMSFLGNMGRDGDSIVAHINPQEAALLKALGGRGTPNPNTGLLEFAPIDRNSGLGRLIFADTGDAEINRIHNDFFTAYNGANEADRTGVVSDFVGRRQARLKNLNNSGLARYRQTYDGQTFEGADTAPLLGEVNDILAGRNQREQFLRGATGRTTGVAAIDALNREYSDKFAGLGDTDFNTLTSDIQRRRQALVPTLSIDDLNRYKSAYSGGGYDNLVAEADGALAGISGTDTWLNDIVRRDSGVSSLEGAISNFQRDWRGAGAGGREDVSRRYEEQRKMLLQSLSDTDLDKYLSTYGDLGNLRGEYQAEINRRRNAAGAGTGSTSWMSQITGAASMLQQLQSVMGGLFPTAAPAQSASFRDASVMPTPRRRWKVNPYTGALEAGEAAAPRRSFGATIMA